MTGLSPSALALDQSATVRAAHHRAMMTTNEGVLDRVARIMAGYLLLSAFFLIDGNARWLTLIGFAPLLTGILGWCPLYGPLRISTCARRS